MTERDVSVGRDSCPKASIKERSKYAPEVPDEAKEVASGERLHVVALSKGSGAPIVFLHGIGGTHRYWMTGVQPPVFPMHQTVLVDLLGFGDSPQPWCRYTVDRHLDALHATLADYGQMTLVGHSMGAVLALAYAARYPESVKRLYLIAMPYFGNQAKAYEWFRRSPGGWIYTNMVTTAVACMISRRVLGKLLPRLLPDIPRLIAQDLVKHNFMSSTTSMWEVLYRHDAAADAHELTAGMPVHCVHGTRDASAPLPGVRQLAASRTNWQVTLLDDVDHHPWLRRPEWCREALQAFLVD